MNHFDIENRRMTSDHDPINPLLETAPGNTQPRAMVPLKLKSTDCIVAEEMDALPKCCHETLIRLQQLNDMMVCPQCKNIIKCFHDEVSYRRYIKFCETKKRPIKITHLDQLFLVTFKAFSTT